MCKILHEIKKCSRDFGLTKNIDYPTMSNYSLPKKEKGKKSPYFLLTSGNVSCRKI